jgi:very-short-patch-repair endonuclease
MADYPMYQHDIIQNHAAALRACDEARNRTSMTLVFTLSTALALLGIEPPRERTRLQDDVVYAAVHHESDRWRVKGVRFVTWPGSFETVVLQRGRFRCVHAVYVWAMYAARLSLQELVVLGDSMMRRNSRGIRIEDFIRLLQNLREETQVRGLRLPRGFRSMSRAVRLMREHTDSSQETRLRLLLMRYGLGCPRINVPIRIPDSGRLFYLDMAYPEKKLAVEYDGTHHRDQWLADCDRLKFIDEQGWQHIQVTAYDLSSEEQRERLVSLVAKKLGMDALSSPLTLEQVADGRRVWNR